MAIGTRTPKLTVDLAVVVHLEVERTDIEKRSHRLASDDGTIGVFLQWQLDEGVFPIRGFSTTGPGFLWQVFHADDGPRVQAWLTDHIGPSSDTPENTSQGQL